MILRIRAPTVSNLTKNMPLGGFTYRLSLFSVPTLLSRVTPGPFSSSGSSTGSQTSSQAARQLAEIQQNVQHFANNGEL